MAPVKCWYKNTLRKYTKILMVVVLLNGGIKGDVSKVYIMIVKYSWDGEIKFH